MGVWECLCNWLALSVNNSLNGSIGLKNKEIKPLDDALVVISVDLDSNMPQKNENIKGFQAKMQVE